MTEKEFVAVDTEITENTENKTVSVDSEKIIENEKINDSAETAEEMETLNFSGTEKTYAFIIAVLAFLWLEFQIFNPAGFITTAVNIAIITASVVFLKKNDCKFTAVNKIIAVILYLFSFVFSITDNGLIKFLAGVFLFIANAYFIYSAAEGKNEIEKFFPAAIKKAVLEFPVSNMHIQPLAVKSSLGHSKSAGNIKHILLGLLMTIPVTFVVASLLASADEGMENILNGLFSKTFSDNGFEILLHFIVSIPCGMYLFGMLYSNCKRDNIEPLDSALCEFRIDNMGNIPNMVLYTAVTPVLLLYVLFFITQAGYFLSPFTGTLPEGFTYSEYARRGFFELCAVTLINLAIIIFISFFSQKHGRNKPAALKFYTLALSFSTIILIIVSISKMIMYISEYGLTRLRFYTMWFMLLCAAVFILIIAKQFNFDMKFSAWFSGIFTVMFAFLCFCSPDYLIAKYNIEMYRAGYLDELDTSMIYDMSDDGILCAVRSGEIDVKKAYYVSVESDGELIDYLNISSLILREKLGEIELTAEDEEKFCTLNDLF